MAVPSSVTTRLKRLEQARKHVETSRRSDRVDQERRAAVALRRSAERQTLMALAQDIFDWRDQVARSGLWNHIGSGARIYLFADWYWDGLPIMPENGIGARTYIALDGPHHHFLVEEWRKGDEGIEVPFQEVCRVSSPIQMVDALHPALIESLQTHLSGPEAWQPIIDELDARLDRYMPATRQEEPCRTAQT